MNLLSNISNEQKSIKYSPIRNTNIYLIIVIIQCRIYYIDFKYIHFFNNYTNGKCRIAPLNTFSTINKVIQGVCFFHI